MQCRAVSPAIHLSSEDMNNKTMKLDYQQDALKEFQHLQGQHMMH